MKHTPLESDELWGLAGHIAYEVEMLVLTCRELLARGLNELSDTEAPTDADRLLNNLLVESFLIHARSLDDFLSYGEPERRPGDVLAVDYNAAWVPGEVLPARVRDVINRRVAHLTIDRLVFLVGIQPAIIARRLLSGFREFAATLPELRWPALDRAATRARDHLDYLDGLGLPEYVVSTTNQNVMTHVSSTPPYFSPGYPRATGHASH